MPNHVTHRVIITGADDKLDTFLKTFVVNKEETDYQDKPNGKFFDRFDFNTIVPMPACIDRNDASGLELGLTAIGRTDVLKQSEGFNLYRTVYDWPFVKALGITTPEALRKYLEVNRPDEIPAAERGAKAFDEVGFKDWFDWSIEKWGTKWNSYDYDLVDRSPGRLEFKFDTAWSTPSPIWEALAKRPEVEGLLIEFKAFNEGWFPVTIGQVSNGFYLEGEAEATDELYTEIHGEPPYSEDDDEEAGKGEVA